MGGSHGLDDLSVFGSLDGYGRLTQGLDGPVAMDGALAKILHTIQTSHVIYMGQTIQTLHDLGDLDDLDNSDGSDAISKSDGVDVLVELASDV